MKIINTLRNKYKNVYLYFQNLFLKKFFVLATYNLKAFYFSL